MITEEEKAKLEPGRYRVEIVRIEHGLTAGVCLHDTITIEPKPLKTVKLQGWYSDSVREVFYTDEDRSVNGCKKITSHRFLEDGCVEITIQDE